MKASTKKAAIATPVAPIAEFRVWCDSCCIRIAPNEERTMVRDKAYHVSCHTRLPVPTRKGA